MAAWGASTPMDTPVSSPGVQPPVNPLLSAVHGKNPRAFHRDTTPEQAVVLLKEGIVSKFEALVSAAEDVWVSAFVERGAGPDALLELVLKSTTPAAGDASASAAASAPTDAEAGEQLVSVLRAYTALFRNPLIVESVIHSTTNHLPKLVRHMLQLPPGSADVLKSYIFEVLTLVALGSAAGGRFVGDLLSKSVRMVENGKNKFSFFYNELCPRMSPLPAYATTTTTAAAAAPSAAFGGGGGGVGPSAVSSAPRAASPFAFSAAAKTSTAFLQPPGSVQSTVALSVPSQGSSGASALPSANTPPPSSRTPPPPSSLSALHPLTARPPRYYLYLLRFVDALITSQPKAYDRFVLRQELAESGLYDSLSHLPYHSLTLQNKSIPAAFDSLNQKMDADAAQHLSSQYGARLDPNDPVSLLATKWTSIGGGGSGNSGAEKSRHGSSTVSVSESDGDAAAHSRDNTSGERLAAKARGSFGGGGSTLQQQEQQRLLQQLMQYLTLADLSHPDVNSILHSSLQLLRKSVVLHPPAAIARMQATNKLTTRLTGVLRAKNPGAAGALVGISGGSSGGGGAHAGVAPVPRAPSTNVSAHAAHPAGGAAGVPSSADAGAGSLRVADGGKDANASASTGGGKLSIRERALLLQAQKKLEEESAENATKETDKESGNTTAIATATVIGGGEDAGGTGTAADAAPAPAPPPPPPSGGPPPPPPPPGGPPPPPPPPGGPGAPVFGASAPAVLPPIAELPDLVDGMEYPKLAIAPIRRTPKQLGRSFWVKPSKAAAPSPAPAQQQPAPTAVGGASGPPPPPPPPSSAFTASPAAPLVVENVRAMIPLTNTTPTVNTPLGNAAAPIDVSSGAVNVPSSGSKKKKGPKRKCTVFAMLSSFCKKKEVVVVEKKVLPAEGETEEEKKQREAAEHRQMLEAKKKKDAPPVKGMQVEILLKRGLVQTGISALSNMEVDQFDDDTFGAVSELAEMVTQRHEMEKLAKQGVEQKKQAEKMKGVLEGQLRAYIKWIEDNGLEPERVYGIIGKLLKIECFQERLSLVHLFMQLAETESAAGKVAAIAKVLKQTRDSKALVTMLITIRDIANALNSRSNKALVSFAFELGQETVKKLKNVTASSGRSASSMTIFHLVAQDMHASFVEDCKSKGEKVTGMESPDVAELRQLVDLMEGMNDVKPLVDSLTGAITAIDTCLKDLASLQALHDANAPGVEKIWDLYTELQSNAAEKKRELSEALETLKREVVETLEHFAHEGKDMNEVVTAACVLAKEVVLASEEVVETAGVVSDDEDKEDEQEEESAVSGHDGGAAVAATGAGSGASVPPPGGHSGAEAGVGVGAGSGTDDSEQASLGVRAHMGMMRNIAYIAPSKVASEEWAQGDADA